MLKKYLLNTSGNFGMMFGIISTMLVLGVGVAIDFAGITSEKSTLQDMSDAAVLAAVSSGEENLAVLKKIAAESLKANNFSNLPIDFDLKLDGQTVTIELKSSYNTKLMSFVGQDKMPVGALSEAKLPEEIPINIALVLDRTGSMAGANMTSLQAASAVLVDEFSSYDSDTRVAVVPFSNYVNVGLANRNETWIDVPADGTIDHPAGECYMVQPTECTATEDYDIISDGVKTGETGKSCTNSVAVGPEEQYCPPAWTETITWNGCIGSRDGIYNQTASYKGKRIPGIMNVECGEEVLPLTTDMTQVKARIDSLTASKNTYIPAGLINGWRMLDADKPFGNLSNKEEKRKRALILMTDGANTISLEDPYMTGAHKGSDADEANDLTATLCKNIKDEGIDIWAVAYNFDDAVAKNMLQACSSSSGQFFDASNQADLIKAFEEISKSLFTVRLSR